MSLPWPAGGKAGCGGAPGHRLGSREAPCPQQSPDLVHIQPVSGLRDGQEAQLLDPSVTGSSYVRFGVGFRDMLPLRPERPAIKVAAQD